jgi:predicted ATPase
LHFGPKITPQIEAKLEFEVEKGVDAYHIRLFHAAGDTLIFAEETLSFLQTGWPSPRTDELGAGHQETRIKEAAKEGKPTAKMLEYLLNRCRVYHFHDTSSTAGVRQSSYVGNDRWLMPDAGNLPALLLRFRKENGGAAYQRIIGTIRLIAPFFDDFVLEPDVSNRVILNWRHKESDQVFGPHQFSDGTLRAIGLATLLLQPEDELPELIVVDEPELGLHPYALNVIAALFSKAALHTQILISTQSSSFLDNFDPEDVIAVNLEGKESQFKRLNSTELDAWLDEYSLGEVWEKNIFGGGPH